jgi:hypothetical protein
MKIRVLLWHLSEFIENIPCWHLKGLHSTIVRHAGTYDKLRVVGHCLRCNKVFEILL